MSRPPSAGPRTGTVRRLVVAALLAAAVLGAGPGAMAPGPYVDASVPVITASVRDADVAALDAASEVVRDRLLVRWAPEVPASRRTEVLAAVLGGLPPVVAVTPRVDAVLVPEADLAGLAREVTARTEVELAGPDRVLPVVHDLTPPAAIDGRPAAPDGAPDDPLFGVQWGLWNPGLPVGPPEAALAARPDLDIDVLAAWPVTRGSPEVRVAVVDTAIDVTHPDLQGAIATTVEVTSGPATGRDHGTAVVSVLAARSGDAVGMAGVAPGIQVVSIAAFGGRGAGPGSSTISAVLAGFEAARQVGADVINASWVTAMDDPLLRAAITDAGVPVVAASGNGGRALTPVSRLYPATYELPNLLTVTAIGPDGSLPAFANRGAAVVDLAAPGEALVAARDGGGHTWVTGTSFAVPHVSGALALARSVAPEASVEELVDAVRWTSRAEPALVGQTVTGGLLDVGALVEGVQRPVCGTGPEAAPFDDIPSDRPDARAIACLARLGLVAGRDGARFAPAEPATRAQVATILAGVLAADGPRTTGPAAAEPAAPPFLDVPADHLHAATIAVLAERGIVRGDGAGRFHPDRPITAGQLAALLVRLDDTLTGSAPTAPSRVWFDDTVATTHEAAIHRARDLGLVRGIDRLTFAPWAPRDRGQVAATVAAQVDALARRGVGAW